jgi:four helix bundle protein
MNEKADALQERIMRFSLQASRFCRTLTDTWEGRLVAEQLFRCATGLASNYGAARRGRSHREFTAKLGIVLDESDESVFWLLILQRSEIADGADSKLLLNEARELAAIFTSSVRTANSKHQPASAKPPNSNTRASQR